ncbi:MFS transporter [Nonomuraea longispora]|uniref:MFS transporter n=1 Tax=Nonomuraea longispora TaxID=1848320 RepID=UPI001C700E96|nr:MFS transporter [Nonomuraea longispora]
MGDVADPLRLAVALYAVAAFLPQGLVSIFGGVLADRMNRRVLVMAADGAIAAATLALALLMANGVTDLWIVLLAVAVRSLGAGVQTPAVQALIPQIVPGEHLMRVNGIFQTIQSAMALIAPAAAGAIFAASGLVPVFFLDVVTAVIGIGLLALVTVPTLERAAEARASYRQDLTEGMRYIRTQPIVRWLLVVYAVIFLLTVAPSFVTPLMVARTFGSEEWMLAALEIAFGLGMLLGGVLMSTVLAKRSRMGLILVAVYGFGLVTVALGLSGNLWVFYGFMFMFGLLVPLFSTPFMTLIQETVEPAMHGRVFSYVGIVMALATPIGMVVFGPLADVVSVQVLLMGAGLAAIVVIAIAARVPSGRSTIAAARAHATYRSDAGTLPGEETAGCR